MTGRKTAKASAFNFVDYDRGIVIYFFLFMSNSTIASVDQASCDVVDVNDSRLLVYQFSHDGCFYVMFHLFSVSLTFYAHFPKSQTTQFRHQFNWNQYIKCVRAASAFLDAWTTHEKKRMCVLFTACELIILDRRAGRFDANLMPIEPNMSTTNKIRFYCVWCVKTAYRCWMAFCVHCNV